MKKMIFLAATILAISTISCSSGSGDPKSVLMSFIDALGKKDITTAKKYATKDSESMLGMMEMGMKMAPAAANDKDNEFDKNNMEFGDAVIDGDKATVPIKNKKSGDNTTYTLKKEGGSWKVAFDKATMTQMGTDKMKGMQNGNSNGMSTDTTGAMSPEMNKMMDSATNMMNNMKTDTVH